MKGIKLWPWRTGSAKAFGHATAEDYEGTAMQ